MKFFCNNFRPVSKLFFLSKLLEKVVQLQLITFLNTANLLRFKVQGFFICHMINYTGYNQK